MVASESDEATMPSYAGLLPRSPSRRGDMPTWIDRGIAASCEGVCGSLKKLDFEISKIIKGSCDVFANHNVAYVLKN